MEPTMFNFLNGILPYLAKYSGRDIDTLHQDLFLQYSFDSYEFLSACNLLFFSRNKSLNAPKLEL